MLTCSRRVACQLTILVALWLLAACAPPRGASERVYAGAALPPSETSYVLLPQSADSSPESAIPRNLPQPIATIKSITMDGMTCYGSSDGACRDGARWHGLLPKAVEMMPGSHAFRVIYEYTLVERWLGEAFPGQLTMGPGTLMRAKTSHADRDVVIQCTLRPGYNYYLMCENCDFIREFTNNYNHCELETPYHY